jgi:hypothetical protein
MGIIGEFFWSMAKDTFKSGVNYIFKYGGQHRVDLSDTQYLSFDVTKVKLHSWFGEDAIHYYVRARHSEGIEDYKYTMYLQLLNEGTNALIKCQLPQYSNDGLLTVKFEFDSKDKYGYARIPYRAMQLEPGKYILIPYIHVVFEKYNHKKNILQKVIKIDNFLDETFNKSDYAVAAAPLKITIKK